ncbi:cytochrome P450 [Cryphonectria parasitica EP155]|uniref:Cytochrome P450 n=1 Tax=Cryphonectria parasitica (strain ATCC 38755 / EP155) TaxID=660469 RepID=A0A9P5CMW4_CRYP1|nr:cytochrome P450 [Cryphonectria parasitica EP155]KAF3763682.1 cytochrome P450 [Cryphonectria parasitica EP155]
MLDSILLLVAALAIYYVATAFYCLTFHPLAGYPGPKLCTFSRLPYWSKYFRGRDVPWMKDLHDTYGPVVRFGPTDLSYASAQAWQDIHGPKVTEKAQEFFPQPVNNTLSILTTDQECHTRYRRLFAPAFSERALKQQQHLFKKYVDLLMYKISEVGNDGNEPVEMTQLLNFTTFDVMAELCFGQNLDLLANNEYSPWVRAIFESLKMLPFVSVICYYPVLNTIFTRFEPKWVTKQRVAHCRHSAERVDKRLEMGSDQPDVWNLVMEASEKGKGLTIEEMHSNSEIFMLAGSETTATLLSGAIYYLLCDQKRLNMLVEEVRSSFHHLDDINFDSLANLKYLNACLKEALRVYPPVPIGSPRLVLPGGSVICGKWVPADTRVSVHHWSTYHSEANFKDADKYIPERWLGEDPNYDNDDFASHQPFGFGPRNCLGQNMAKCEMRLILATMLFKYDLELCEESRDWEKQQAYALWIKGALMVRAKPVMAQVRLKI